MYELEILPTVGKGAHGGARRPVRIIDQEGKQFHTAEAAFLRKARGTVAAAVLSGRVNFRPRR